MQAPQDTTGWFLGRLEPRGDLLLKIFHFLYRENKTQAKPGNPATQKDLKQEDQNCEVSLGLQNGFKNNWRKLVTPKQKKELWLRRESLGSLCEGATSIPNTETGKCNSDPPEIHQVSTAVNLIQGRSHLGRPSISSGWRRNKRSSQWPMISAQRQWEG